MFFLKISNRFDLFAFDLGNSPINGLKFLAKVLVTVFETKFQVAKATNNRLDFRFEGRDHAVSEDRVDKGRP